VWDDAPQSVLVIQTAFVGDVILLIPLLEAVKILWVETELDVLVRPPADNLLETLPFVRRVWVYDKHGRDRGAGGFLRLRGQLRKQRYDLALVPHRSARSGLLAKTAGIPIRVGFNRGGGKSFHTHPVTYYPSQHEIQRNLQLLSPFGPLPRTDPPVVIPSEEDLHAVEARMMESEGRRTVALAPGSAWFTKRWPEAYYAALGKLLARSGYRVILIGGREDRDLCFRLEKAIGPAALSLAGDLTLRQSAEALRRCALLVTNDSAPTHLGSAAGTRVLTLFGCTVPEFGFGPCGPRGRALGVELYCRPCSDHGRQSCPERHFRCLREITPERVFQEAERVMSDKL